MKLPTFEQSVKKSEVDNLSQKNKPQLMTPFSYILQKKDELMEEIIQMRQVYMFECELGSRGDINLQEKMD